MKKNQAELIQKSQHEYLVSGMVDFTTVPDLVKQFLDYSMSSQSANNVADITIDFSKVSSCNSAGLALMFEAQKKAKSNNIKLHFDNLPGALFVIAKAYGVENEIREICK